MWLNPAFRSGPMFEYTSRRLNSYDAPEHTRLRSLVNKGFTARRVEALRPRIQKIADELLDTAEVAREFDVLEILAHPLPCQVICEMIGVPLSDSPQLSQWTRAVHSVLGPVARPDHMDGANQAAGEFMAYIRALVAKRRTAPGEDLLNALIVAEEHGERLSEEELVATVLFMFTAFTASVGRTTRSRPAANVHSPITRRTGNGPDYPRLGDRRDFRARHCSWLDPRKPAGLGVSLFPVA
jgi:cytochrome P450